MVDGGLGLGLRRQGRLVETLFENGFDTFIGTGADLEGTATGGFEPLGAITLAQTHNAQARAEALLGMGTRFQNRFVHSRSRRAAGSSPLNEALWGPLGVLLVRFGHVSGHRGMAPLEVGASVAGDAIPSSPRMLRGLD